MADEKKAEELVKTEEVVKPIEIWDKNGNFKYLLEFDRDTVKWAESRGFNTESEGIRITDTEELFWYSFRKHHPNVSRAETDRILYEDLHGLSPEVFQRLVKLFTIPYEALIQTEEGAKNATLTIKL